MDILIVIPARYASSRFPGKPLVRIAGTEMIKRVAAIAESVCRKNAACRHVVATDDLRILDFCAAESIPALMTSASCRSGTERCRDVMARQETHADLVINLQGDNPLCPPHVIQALIDAWRRSGADVVTPCVRLSWAEYEGLLRDKAASPHSGTTVLIDRQGFALTFSKEILPHVRNVSEAKRHMQRSPVRRHIGLYGYSQSALHAYFALPPSLGEQPYLEGLEQMRFLENGLRVKTVDVDYFGRESCSGVDSPEDVTRVERILAEFGELDIS
ncbi:MAG: 3-deoxy-manno-octulosonate cytidylyltransferase [Desulfovibrio sp.]|jgi:3-deoxy-manno-octulosonate cytidylyltransferase (CMP-KDO synthetase)|nr:3-deoxy-manno-octulosonate cytidylyltransferase [Desulfovibrio sp.]